MIKGALLIFIITAVLGSLLSYVYIGLVDVIPFIYANVITAAAFAAALGFIVHYVKKSTKMTSGVAAVIAVIPAIIVINYVKWQLFFGMWYFRFSDVYLSPFLDLRIMLEAFWWIVEYPFINNLNPISDFFGVLQSFNDWGTWGLDGGNAIRGIPLAIIWIVEFIIIFIPPIYVAAKPVGIFVADSNELRNPIYLMQTFQPFTDEEVERAVRGDIDVILNKPQIGAPSVIEYGIKKNGTQDNKPKIMPNAESLSYHEVGRVAILAKDKNNTDYNEEYITITNVKPKPLTQGEISGKTPKPIRMGNENVKRLVEAFVQNDNS